MLPKQLHYRLLLPAGIALLFFGCTTNRQTAHSDTYTQPSAIAEPAIVWNDHLGQAEAIRTYAEFADGRNRGLFSPETGTGGFPDEDFDATTAMVINWHRLPEADPRHDAALKYRKVWPEQGTWNLATGASMEFWHREERINRVVLRGLHPNSVYEYRVREGGISFHLRTMPSSLDEREVTLAITADHQVPSWNQVAHDIAQLTAELDADMFLVAGDFVNCEGAVTEENARRWATYLDLLYNVEDGYLLVDLPLTDTLLTNRVIPHVGIPGNHEIGATNHLLWPAGVMTNMSEPGYPVYRPAHWMEQLFHWPFRSEGFYSEVRPDHPNIDPEHLRAGYGKGGFGALHFSDYLLLVALDNNSQNWPATPPVGLHDWRHEPIADTWPWFETFHSDVRQDLWLKQLLEPDNAPSAGERFTHILPVWHRGLFGTNRKSMTIKNRDIFTHWLPVLQRNGVKLIKEAHDHLYVRTVPMALDTLPPAGSSIDRVRYNPRNWSLPEDADQQYIDAFFTVEVVRDDQSGEIIGWKRGNQYLSYAPDGFRVLGHGGWAAGRAQPGTRGGGNAGFWFVDEALGGETYGGSASYHLNIIQLHSDGLTSKAFHPDALQAIRSGLDPEPLHLIHWNEHTGTWSDQAEATKHR